jgi:hypothetical protein
VHSNAGAACKARRRDVAIELRKEVAMRRTVSLALALAFVVLGTGRLVRAQVEDAEKSHASIEFVSLGGIDDWRAEGNRAMLIKGLNGGWYRAEFFAPCAGLQFRNRVAFVTDGTDRLDRFSSILVDGERCWFRSFDKIDPEAPLPSSTLR